MNIPNIDNDLLILYDYINSVVNISIEQKIENYINNSENTTYEESYLTFKNLRHVILEQEITKVMTQYLTQNLHLFPKKRKMILYMFYEIYHYQQMHEDEKISIPDSYTEMLYNLKNNEYIFREIINKEVLQLIIKSYFQIIDSIYGIYEDYENDEEMDLEESFNDMQNEEMGTILSEKSLDDFNEFEVFQCENETFTLPELFKLMLTDLNSIYVSCEVSEYHKLYEMIYQIFREDESIIPSPLDLSFEEIFSNTKIFLEDMYLNSLIYFECKDQSLGLTQEETLIFQKIKGESNKGNPLEKIIDDDEKIIILKAYLHMCYNNKKINTNYPNIVNDCLNLTRKRINPICTLPYK